MADKTSNGTPGRSDLDPFAELTRIMGFDPRIPVDPAQAPQGSEPPVAAKDAAQSEADAEDFGIDLEQELLGEFAGDEPRENEENVAASVGSPAAESDGDDLPELDLQEIEDEISEHVDAYLASSDFEEVVAASDDPPGKGTNGRAHHQTVAEADLRAVASDGGLDLDHAIDTAFAEPTALEEDDTSSGDWEPVPFLSGRPAGEHLSARSMTKDASPMAEVDMNFGSDADLQEVERTAPVGDVAQLEAEYNALLGNADAEASDLHRSDQKVEEPAKSKVDEAALRAASIITGAWRKPLNLGPAEAAIVDEKPLEAVQADFDATDEVGESEALAMAAAAFDELPGETGYVETAGQDEEPPLMSEPQSKPEDPFAALAAMAAQYQNGNPDRAWRETVSKYEMPKPAAPATSAEIAPVQTRPSAPSAYASSYARQPAPEIATVDVHDEAVAVADDLHLPEIPYEQPVSARYDDLDAEFNNLLQEMSSGEKREPAPRSYAEVGRQPAYADVGRQPANAEVHRQPAHVEQFAAPPVRTQPAAQPVMPQQAHPRQAGVSDREFEDAMAAFEAEVEDDEGYADLGPAPAAMAPQRPRRGLLIAAVVGGLALIGGISVVAMSFGGSNEDEIALIKADATPVKIRPENPGGPTVPNQDSTVYDTVSRSAASEAPTQERLVTNSEEPIDLPAPNDEEVDEFADVAKGEDRIEPTDQPDVAANEETIAVAPRKVRTMVVKSDGSLAPREELAPAKAASAPEMPAPAAPEANAAETDPGTEQITTGATSPTASQADAEEVAALPEQPAKPAIPPAGSWSVQVSSQPSEDGANKSLKDISRKYAGVIGDRGANIVKADVAGKGTFWRVRIAAGSRDEAVSLCGDLKAAGGSCFVTK